MMRDTSLGRYRFDKHFRLPQFGAKKNPFELARPTKPTLVFKTEPVPSSNSESTRTPEGEPNSESPPAQVAEPAMLERQIQEPALEAQPTHSQKNQRLPEILPAKTRISSDWLRKTPAKFFAGLKYVAASMNPLTWLPKRKVSAETTSSKVGRQAAQPQLPQQPELRLENVRVVRNDLNDTDLEVVTAKASALTSDTPAARLKRKALMHASSSPAYAEQT